MWEKFIDKTRCLVNWPMQFAFFDTKFGGASISAQIGYAKTLWFRTGGVCTKFIPSCPLLIQKNLLGSDFHPKIPHYITLMYHEIVMFILFLRVLTIYFAIKS